MSERRPAVVGRFRCAACGVAYATRAGLEVRCPSCGSHEGQAWEDWEEVVRSRGWGEGAEAAAARAEGRA
jgi:hypothetical protein